MKIEWWKFIPGYDCRYMVSDKGRVLSLNYKCTGKIKILRYHKDDLSGGYLRVNIQLNGKNKTPRIHRLVALAFLPIPEHLKHLPLNKIQVNHKDENKLNNCVENLEWCDDKYNVNYGTALQRMGAKMSTIMKNRQDQSKPVNQYTLDREFVKWYPSIAEAQRQTGINQSNILKCCSGVIYNGKQHKTAGGFKWSYA